MMSRKPSQNHGENCIFGTFIDFVEASFLLLSLLPMVVAGDHPVFTGDLDPLKVSAF